MTDRNAEPLRAKPWQAKISRRGFIGTGTRLATAAALAGYLPESVLKAQAAAASSRSSFDLSQVKHLVFLMQENRSFDHCFGTYPGVRGFSDPHAVKLPNGRSVFQQPDPANRDGYLEPFHLDTINAGGAAVPSLSHNWQPQHASWNRGAMDGWVRSKIEYGGPGKGQYTMGYLKREDIPFHWALADAFTLLDGHHCSVLGPTDCNRLFWENGTIDPQGLGGGPLLETGGDHTFTFESGAETLFKAGISFKCYGAPGTFKWFPKLQSRTGIPIELWNAVNASGALFGDGTPGGIGNPANPTPATHSTMAFEEDCANGVLPDVSVIAANNSSEHPPSLPAKGAAFLAGKLDALLSNQDLWNTTVFVIQYDENDGFFDHVVPPTPDPDEFPEEFVTMPSPLGTPGGNLPVGAGFRVPCWVVSPWSTGGKIFSDVSDHGSCLRLVESVAAAGGLSGRGPVTYPNLSRWRRQTFSDLTGALSGTAQPAPTSPEFDPAVRAANVAAQTESANLPLPAFPGADQSAPFQVKK
ncbi:phospholipase C [Actinacidiphila acididurans]|uniref:phospholipase C n=1 Tax=Actinacidiphila acididurans TaxID=2784346 RepID=A0ABS2TYQ8_9ACTN|nr:alkaline phosphatase family protein [Actinacidiphila acididurans]MBM9507440.1 phospholipase [Actinacidiphila acididurans]